MQASPHRSRRRPNHYRPVYPRLSLWPSERGQARRDPVRWRGVVRASFLPVARSAPVDTSRIAAFPVFTDLPAAELDVLAAAMSEVEIEASGEVVTLTTTEPPSTSSTGRSRGPDRRWRGDPGSRPRRHVRRDRTPPDGTAHGHSPRAHADGLLHFRSGLRAHPARVPELERSLRRLGLERASR